MIFFWLPFAFSNTIKRSFEIGDNPIPEQHQVCLEIAISFQTNDRKSTDVLNVDDQQPQSTVYSLNIHNESKAFSSTTMPKYWKGARQAAKEDSNSYFFIL